jgi:hypothetical protein
MPRSTEGRVLRSLDQLVKNVHNVESSGRVNGLGGHAFQAPSLAASVAEIERSGNRVALPDSPPFSRPEPSNAESSDNRLTTGEDISD